MDKNETIEMVKQAYATYNQQLLMVDEQVTFRAWHDLLSDIEYATVKKAFLQLATYEKYMPRPGDIRRAAIDLQTEIPQLLDAYSAWGIFQGIVREVNSGVQTGIPKPESLVKTLEKLGDSAWGMHTNGDRDAFVRVYDEVVRNIERAKYAIPEEKAV
jgi:hypothetical protein